MRRSAAVERSGKWWSWRRVGKIALAGGVLLPLAVTAIDVALSLRGVAEDAQPTSITIGVDPGSLQATGTVDFARVWVRKQPEGMQICLLVSYRYPYETGMERRSTDHGGEVTIAGAKILGYGSVHLYGTGELEPGDSYSPRLDMTTLTWSDLSGMDATNLTLAIPSITPVEPQPPFRPEEPPEMLEYESGCFFIEPKPVERIGLAKSRYILRWGDPTSAVGPAMNDGAEVAVLFDDFGTTPVRELIPQPTFEESSMKGLAFDYNQPTDIYVTYGSRATETFVLGMRALAAAAITAAFAKVATEWWNRRPGTPSRTDTAPKSGNRHQGAP